MNAPQMTMPDGSPMTGIVLIPGADNATIRRPFYVDGGIAMTGDTAAGLVASEVDDGVSFTFCKVAPRSKHDAVMLVIAGSETDEHGVECRVPIGSTNYIASAIAGFDVSGPAILTVASNVDQEWLADVSEIDATVGIDDEANQENEDGPDLKSG